jgi:cytochrome b6-f complex iron-sulfur subunit
MVKNKKKSESTDPEPTRRSFLMKIWAGLGLIAFMEFIWVILTFLKPRKPRIVEKNSGQIITAGSVDDFSHDSVTTIRRGRFYLSRLSDGGFLAMSYKCTHLGCAVTWDSEKKLFECPCHSSAFNINGNVISPPAPRALDLYSVVIENGIVKVDTSQRIKRKKFNKEQVAFSK